MGILGNLTFIWMGYSIILQSYLGEYQGCASDRENKLRRAINSVINQTYKDWELLVISDGCPKTIQIASEFRGVRIFVLPKQKLWTGVLRNVGISKATKKYIMYLDSDDMYTPTYLKDLNLKNRDWYFVDDIVWEDGFVKRKCYMDQKFQCGTSNIIHKDLGIKWGDTYLHDWDFIQRLRAFKNHKILNVAGYKVMHIPKKYDI